MNSLTVDELNAFPDELEQAVMLLAKSATMNEAGSAHGFSVRMPTIVYATVKAMAEHSGLSVNRVVVQILRVGIDAVGQALPGADAHAIADIRARMIRDLVEAEKFDQVED